MDDRDKVGKFVDVGLLEGPDVVRSALGFRGKFGD